MAVLFPYPAHDALQVIDGPLARELSIHRYDGPKRSKAQLFGMGGPLGRQFAIVLGNTDVVTGYHPAKQTRMLFEKYELPPLAGIEISTEPYQGSRIRVQQDSKLQASNQVSCLVADESTLVALLRWYAGVAAVATDVSAFELTRVTKAARDAGFDLGTKEEGGWTVFRSTAFPTQIGVSFQGEETYAISLSDREIGARLHAELRVEACTATALWPSCFTGISGYEALYSAIQRIAMLARALGEEALLEFSEIVKRPPNSTEAVRQVVQRVGQDIFRRRLIQYWGGKCAMTGLNIETLLRASHIKPWANCDTDEERLDVFNGLLLAPHLDALFDKRLITFSADGYVVRSAYLSDEHVRQLGLDFESMPPIALSVRHQEYLAWHRAHPFGQQV
ncbi:MAG: hypothetical protein FHP94_03210 [Denitromonas halophila]|nr:MAG: hypothetical protein FHP94_03210 [Denitromonas halophila]TVT72865.1 MAG: hypothetical protein FHP93_07710 [Denitromonas halophila]